MPEPDADHRIYLGDTIVAELRASGLPLEPRQFEFWFAYKSGRNAALRAEADAIQARDGALGAEDIARLHEKHLSPFRLAEGPEAIVTRLTGKLQELALSIEGTIDAALSQREALAAETAELSVNAAVTLQDVLGSIDRLAQSTRESQVRYALLEARMDAIAREVGALKQQLSAVRVECQTDPTTALPNRALFDASLAQALERAAAERQPLSVMLCNLDYFAAFNENFGTYVGDQVLRSICLLFKAHMRPLDMIARLRGDAFVAILPQLRSREAVAGAERFRQVLMAQQLIPGVNGAGRVTVSIGVADAVTGDTPELLLRRAADGLDVAKREGRNRVVEMTPDGPVWARERRA
jgi:diguanylate cyclase (GGDEF)-like protein